MAKIISVINRRGGVGKTATAHSLGAGLITKGYKVLFIDLDSQCNLTFDLKGRASSLTSLEVLTGTARVDEAIQHINNYDVLVGSPSLAVADTTLTEIGKEYRLKEALNEIKELYDFIIIDTPPALNILTVNALVSCNYAVIPAQAEIHSLQGIALLNETIGPIKKYCNHDLKIAGILITRFNARATISKDMRNNLEQIANSIGTRVFKTAIRECTAIKEAQAMQMDIFSYNNKCNASIDYMEFINELLQMEQV